MFEGVRLKTACAFRRLTPLICLSFTVASAALAAQQQQDPYPLNKPLLLPPADAPFSFALGAKPKADTYKPPLSILSEDATPTLPGSNTPDTRLGLSTFKPPNAFHGDGYTPDSSAQSEQRSKRFSLPSISLKVPLY
jgi:hypothetical protein